MSFDCSWPKLDELIHRAARQGRVLSLETYLNQYPAEKIDQQHDYGRSRWTLLIAACFYKHENIVRMLLRRFQPDADAIGDVKLDFVSDVMCGVSALWVAAAVGHLNIVQLLVEQGGANVNHLSVTRSSPLRAAAYIGHVDIARYLIAHGADMGLVRDGNYTNLMLSAYREHRSLVEYFLDELHCDPNEQDQDGRTPLHYAIDAGSVELVQVLLQRGARNSSQNEFSPVLWAALEARHDLVDAFHNFCSSDREWIEARELLGASYGNIESKNYDLDKAIEHLTLAYRWREEKHLPKVVPSTPPVEAYHFAQECQTLTEFNLILSESHARLHIESLLIQERILGPTSQRYRRAIRFYGALLADAHQYDRSIGLWLYELDLRRQHQIQLDKWHLRDFVHMFAEMIIHHVQQIPRRAILEILQVLHGELAHGDGRDHHLLSLFYLITVISHMPDEQSISASMHEIYRGLVNIVRLRYTTMKQMQNWTLLHLSVMMGRAGVHDTYLAALCKYPCHRTMGLLLRCGAHVDAMDSQRNTPLHLIAQRNDNTDNLLSIIDLLCETGGAHLDCVNEQGQTPLELTTNIQMKVHLRGKLGVGQLKCLCARLIRQRKLPLENGQLASSLTHFIEKH